jgi:hypothetical protein
MESSAAPPSAMRRVLNQMRKEIGLPRAQVADRPGQVTREKILQIAIEVWKKYPQALSDPEYQLGELTLGLVEREINQRVSDLRRGIVVKQAALKDYFN